MTNEEIESKISETASAIVLLSTSTELWGSSEVEKLLGDVARELVTLAYEEAATIADGWDSASNGNHARNVADDVRALRDSLVETVPSR